MKIDIASMVTIVALTASCAPALPPVAAPPPIVAVQLVNHQATIAARQAAFQMSAVVSGGMKAAAERGQPAKSQVFAAKALARWAAVLPRTFPDGSLAPTSRAKPEIWQDRAGFDAQAASYIEAANALVAAAERDDTAGFTAQLAVTQQKCAACHSAFRAEARPR